MTWQVLEADCVAQMKLMDEASVDAVVTDPPYGLEFMGKEWDRLAGDWADVDEAKPEGYVGSDGVLRTKTQPFSASIPRPRYHAGKTSQEWHQAWATEALRVLKPGGHLLAFGGTRTSHRLACAIEDAGFEIRDSVIWLYGSGFPKSLDVSKAIDRAAPRTGMFAPFAVHYGERRKASGLTHAAVCEAIGAHGDVNHGGASVNWESGYGVPTPDQWTALAPLLSLSDEWLPLIERVEAEREVLRERTMVQGGGNAYQLREGDRREVEANLTAPATPEAQRWQGWGTAMKPAHEPIVVARKPLIGTVSRNVSEFGTGALNIDRCRIGTEDNLDGGAYVEQGGRVDLPGADRSVAAAGMMAAGKTTGREYEQPTGRWPANVALSHLPECERVGERRVKAHWGQPTERESSQVGFDGGFSKQERPIGYADPDGLETVEAWSCQEGCPVRELDRQSGEVKGRVGMQKIEGEFRFFGDGEQHFEQGTADTGGASRFFYVAKSSRSERNAGLEGFEERLPDNAIDRASQRVGDEAAPGRGSLTKPMANVHPTVKPVDLMRWLCRLVVPPGGVCLDPFAGSGTTGIACVLEDFDFIGIEREPDYVEIARARIDYWAKQPKQLGLEV